MIKEKLIFHALLLGLIIINISARSFYRVGNNDADHKIDSLYDAGQYEKCKNEILASKASGYSYSDTLATFEKLASCYSYLHQSDSAFILLDYIYSIGKGHLDIGISYDHLLFHDIIADNRMMKYDSLTKTSYQKKNSAKNTILGIELLDIIRKDQEPRSILEYVKKVEKNRGHTAIKIDSLFWAKVKISDQENMEHVTAIIKKWGYPGRSMVGIIPSYAAQIVIRHSDLKYQLEFLPIMKVAAEKGELDGGSVEALEDRSLVLQGKKQFYGTQFCLDSTTHKYSLCPIEDPNHLQDRLNKAKLLYPIP
jgi:hypothetical protein